MTKYLVNTETAIGNIADAIRAKTGSSAALTVADMPAAIATIGGSGGGGGSNFLSAAMSGYNVLIDYQGESFSSYDIIIVNNNSLIIRNSNLCSSIETKASSDPSFSNFNYMPHTIALYRFEQDEYNLNNYTMHEYLLLPKSLRNGSIDIEMGGTPMGSVSGKAIDMVEIQYYYNVSGINTHYSGGVISSYADLYPNSGIVMLAPNCSDPILNE